MGVRIVKREQLFCHVNRCMTKLYLLNAEALGYKRAIEVS